MADQIQEKDFVKMERIVPRISTALSVGDDKNEYINAYSEIRMEFLAALRNVDPIFKTYKKIQPMGSSYEGTRIRRADEFDMNVCIKLPFNKIILENGSKGGFITIKAPGQLELLKRSPQQWENHKAIGLWMDDEGFIYQNKLMVWMQSVSAKAASFLIDSSNAVWSKYRIAIRPKGPSIGLWVTKQNSDFAFSIDFVAVLVFNHPIWPKCVKANYASEFSGEWFAVPKPVNSQSPHHAGKMWRISFPQQERDMLKGLHHLRDAQRMIKQLRENRQFTYLKSYFIKTAFMLMVEKKNSDAFWQKNVSYLFMFMLTDIYEKVRDGCIPFFWDHRYNLLSVLTPNQLRSCKESLQGSIDYIKKNYKDEQKMLPFLMPPANIDDGFTFVEPLRSQATNKEENSSSCVIGKFQEMNLNKTVGESQSIKNIISIETKKDIPKHENKNRIFDEVEGPIRDDPVENTPEELKAMQNNLNEVTEKNVSLEEEKEENMLCKESIPSDTIEEILHEWKKLRNRVLEWHPNPTKASIVGDIYDDAVLQCFRSLLQKREGQAAP